MLETTFPPVLKNSTYYEMVRDDHGSNEAPDPLEASLYLREITLATLVTCREKMLEIDLVYMGLGK